MDLIYTFTFYINTSPSAYQEELGLVRDCLKSLEACKPPLAIFYNQGGFTNQELAAYLSHFNLPFIILGEGVNHGIPRARYDMVRYILEQYPSNKYIVEAHLDMIFTPHWTEPLIAYLDTYDEPCIAPRIVYLSEGKYYALNQSEPIRFPQYFAPKITFLETLTEDTVIEAFVHPIIHKTELLKEIPFYDVGFLTGLQGFEDDSLLLGYSYLMGTRNKWRPKACFRSCVFHKVGGQRFRLDNLGESFERNLKGVVAQYGAYGQKELARIHHGRTAWLDRYQGMLIDPKAYEHDIVAYHKDP